MTSLDLDRARLAPVVRRATGRPDAEWARGRAMAIEEAVADALESR